MMRNPAMFWIVQIVVITFILMCRCPSSLRSVGWSFRPIFQIKKM